MRHAAELADLARTPDEVKTELAAATPIAPSGKPSLKVYPWCTCITLDDEVLKAVGMSGDLPPAGAEVHGCFVGMVKAVRAATERVSADGVKSSDGAHVEIEIRQLGFAAQSDADMEDEKAKKRRKTWYGGEEPDGDEA